MDADDLYLDPAFRRLIIPHTEHELARMEASLLADGLITPLLVWTDPAGRRVLLDGFARLALCRKHGIPVRVEERPQPGRPAALAFRLRLLLAPRHLCRLAQAYYRGRAYWLAGGRQGARTDRPAGAADRPFTAAGVAAEFGVAERTIRRDAALSRALDRVGAADELGAGYKRMVLEGKARLTHQDVLDLLRMRGEERERFARGRVAEANARRAGRRKPAPATAGGAGDRMTAAQTRVQTDCSPVFAGPPAAGETPNPMASATAVAAGDAVGLAALASAWEGASVSARRAFARRPDVRAAAAAEGGAA